MEAGHLPNGTDFGFPGEAAIPAPGHLALLQKLGDHLMSSGATLEGTAVHSQRDRRAFCARICVRRP